MEPIHEQTSRQLLDQEIISEEQHVAVSAYRSFHIFSLHNEILFLMYLGVIVFTGGAGILVYQHIDTIGHTILLLLLLSVTIGCFYFAFKKASAYSNSQTDFAHPFYNYVVLGGSILGGIFINYLEIQYQPFGNRYAWPALLTALFSIAAAYRFDNRPVLSIGITALAAAIGITATPQAVLEANVFTDGFVLYAGILLAVLLALWEEVSRRESIKTHFSNLFLNFSIHLTGICCIVGLCDDYWPIYAIILAVSCWYFWFQSDKKGYLSVFIFVLLYGFIGFNIAFVRTLTIIDIPDFWAPIAILSPIYTVGAIVLFIRAVKQFNRQHS
ncbi:DUF2157 domain-containing protein [Flavobacterium silvaticum]|uniref:DUF2157 domain-containing protein n=1 Tax=Flavobacterium silvaticum TaxID=1852020 RepID=A0A972JHZ4_9FLAO|nr:DUF2157 domain-containing protein [Flavobacterium silvaticum]NMH28455.1 DUF2157 domain-containing protein [Flavobacterium silvaticum]